MSDAHPLYRRVRQELTSALDDGRLTPAELSDLVSQLGQGQDVDLPDEASLADGIRRLAWLLFVRAPSLSGQFLALAPMHLAMIGAGQGDLPSLLDQLEALETEHEAEEADLEEVLTTHGDALATLLSEATDQGATEKRLEAMADALRDKVLKAAQEGRWSDVPLSGPDAKAARAQLASMPEGLGAEVLGLWMKSDQALQSGEAEAAVEALDAAVDLGPEVFETFVRRARALFSTGDRIKAGADLERALKLYPSCAAAHAMRAELRAIIRDMEGSLEDWHAAVAVAPSHPGYRIGRGFTQLAMGRLDQAIGDFSEAVRLAPDDTTPLFNRADAYVRKGDLDAAVADYDKVLELSPDDLDARTNRGTVHLMRRDGDAAVADFEAVLSRRPDRATAWAKRAAAHLNAQRPWPAWLDAITALAAAEADWSHDEQITQMLQVAYQQLDGSPEAAADPDDVDARAKLVRDRLPTSALLRFARLLGTHLPGEHLRYHLLRGTVFLAHSKWDEARDAFRDGLAVDPEHAGAHLGMGRARVALGEAATALESLDTARAATDALPEGDVFELHLATARAHGVLEQLDHAVGAFREALNLRPGRADVWFYLGVHLDLSNDREGSLEAYDQAVMRDPSFAPGWFNRACMHAVLGHKDQALSDLERAGSMEPRWAEEARKDRYFEGLWSDDDFVALVSRLEAAASED